MGEGATGKVYVGLNVNTGELLAVKRIHFDNITRDELAAIEQEILLLQKLRHEHIVSYMAIDITDTNLNILMEFCPGGSVAHLLKAFGALEEDVLRAYTRQVTQPQSLPLSLPSPFPSLLSISVVVPLVQLGVVECVGRGEEGNS